MSGTDGAGDTLHSESPVQDTEGTTVKGATDDNATVPNTDAATDGVAGAIPTETPDETIPLAPDLDASGNAAGKDDAQNDAVAERDVNDTSGTDSLDAVDGAEQGPPQQEGNAVGIHDTEGGVVDDDTYARVRAAALITVNEVRESRQLPRLSLDAALVVPATAHCRVMCEHRFLSHWDITGRKPYQRYSDFAYGQHVSEVVFGFDLSRPTEDEILAAINGCIKERAVEDTVEEGENSNNHLLDDVHTHIGIGVFVLEEQLRYVEVYADRYMELLDVPPEVSAATADSAFQITVQMPSPDIGPYACLVFHDEMPTALTVGELQQQFSGPYTDFSVDQVGIVWPWQMELLDDGVVDIPIPVSPDKPGTFYVQVLVCHDPSSIPYDAEPVEGLPLPGASFCGGAVVLRAPDETASNLGVSELGMDGSPVERVNDTLEEREARVMASTTALRRDFAPIVRVRVVQEMGAIRLQDDGYEQAIFIPSERSEDLAQLNLGVQFLRLGTWDDASSVRCSEEASVMNKPPPDAPAEGETEEAGKPGEQESAVEQSKDTEPQVVEPPSSTETPVDGDAGKIPDSTGETAEAKMPGDADMEGKAAEAGNTNDQTVTGEGGEDKGAPNANETAVATPGPDVDAPPLVLTEIIVVKFGEGENIRPPDGFELLPGDLASSEESTSEVFSEAGIADQAGGEGEGDNKPNDEEGAEGVENASTKCSAGGDRVFLCVKRMPYTDAVSPVTDLALVYGTEGFQMGWGFVTTPMPQAVNDLYGCVVHLCHKKAGASLAVIQQMAEFVAEKSARQIQQHLGIGGDEAQDSAAAGEDEAYDVDTNMTPAQMMEWEEKRNREAEERAEQREQVERDRKRKEAAEAVKRRIAEAQKEKEQLLKTNAEWQKKIAALMLTQQKTREEARTEHGGRGVEKETIPAHESEKHYAECLAAIVNCRERLQEQQAEYDTVAIALQTRLDEKEYKSREIAESFRDFKREIARTAEHSRTGKSIPKGVITQFEIAEAKKDEEIEKVRLKNINLRMMLKKVESNLRAKEQLAEGLHLIDFEQLKIENQTVNEKIEERNEELLKLRKKNTSTVQILTHTKEKLQFVAAENAVTSQQLSSLEDDLNGERDQLTRAKKERDSLRAEVASLKQSQGFANSDLLILDFEQRKLQLKKLGRKLDDMRSKHHLLLLEQERLQANKEQAVDELGGVSSIN